MAEAATVISLDRRRRQHEARDAHMARIIFASMRREFGEAEFFTREDCLHLPILKQSGLATITWYREVCDAITFLKEQGRLLEPWRGELCFAGSEERINPTRLVDVYGDTIERHVERLLRQGEPFGVMDVVDVWRTDPHLTINGKQRATRDKLKQLARGEHPMLIKHEDYTYTRHA